MQRPNMALTKKWDKSNWSLIFEIPKKHKRERRMGEEEEEEEEEKKKRRAGERKSKRYGTMIMSMDLGIFLYGYMFWVVRNPTLK